MRETLVKTEEFDEPLIGTFPKEWEVYPLGTVAEIGSGVTLGRNLSGAGTIELPYLRVANVQDGYLDLCDIKTIRIRREEVSRFLLQPGDVLMNEGGDYDKLGRGTVWTGQISPCLHQNHVFRVRTERQKLLPEFLALVSGSTYGKRFFILSSKQSTNLASINSTQLKSFPVPCPPIYEQQGILDIINASDAAIAHTSSLIAKLKQMKAGLLHDLLTRGLDENGELRDAIGHPEQFKNSPLGRVPKDWKCKRLEEIALKVTDRDHTTPTYVENGVIMVSPVNFINDEDINFAACKRISSSAHLQNRKKTDVHCNDIILHRIGAGLGQVRLVTQGMPEFSILHSLCMVRPDENWVIPSYLLWAFRTYETKTQMELGTQSIGVPDLGLDKISSLVFPVPPLSEQQQIADVLNVHQERIRKEEVYRDKLKLQKQGLMHDLLTGKVRVKNA